MKKTLLFTLALAAICLMSSCKKDPAPNNNGQGEQPTDTIPVGNDTIPDIPVITNIFHFGDATDMIVTLYDSIMEFDENWRPFIFDLNGDGIDDIKIKTNFDGPMAIGQHQTLSLFCLNQYTEILADSVAKESYSHRETITSENDGWIITTHKYILSTCDKIAEDDPVNTTNVFEVFANDHDDSFGIDDHFQSGNAVLFRENVEYSLGNPNESNQTVSVNYSKSIYNCWNFPTDEEKYIGFRINQHGNPRYGWLKIKLVPTWSNKVVNTKIIETAIQK